MGTTFPSYGNCGSKAGDHFPFHHQHGHRTSVAYEVQRDDEEAHVALYLEASDETLEEQRLEAEVDRVERKALHEQPHDRRQPERVVMIGHQPQRGRAARHQGQQQAKRLDVLSSLYSSVLPTYMSSVRQGENEEEALDYALSQVNNLSKKRLLGSLQELKTQLMALEPATNGQKVNPFLNALTEKMLNAAQEVYNYSGIYISYSLSSSSEALKVEPYLIMPSEDNSYVKVMHMSQYNTTHSGIGLFNNHQTAYILFNEREMPQLALFTIYLQLPMYDFPHMLKGLYLCLDYNRNPIARRILFIKHSDSTDMDDFLALKGCIIPREELSEELMPYYNYTCQPGDFIKTCNVPSPLLNEKDLEKEKKMLAI